MLTCVQVLDGVFEGWWLFFSVTHKHTTIQWTPFYVNDEPGETTWIQNKLLSIRLCESQVISGQWYDWSHSPLITNVIGSVNEYVCVHAHAYIAASERSLQQLWRWRTSRFWSSEKAVWSEQSWSRSDHEHCSVIKSTGEPRTSRLILFIASGFGQSEDHHRGGSLCCWRRTRVDCWR